MNKKRNSNITEEINIMNDMKKAFEDIDLNIKHKNFSNKKIIFICGMPRSGTTLVEQIISSHSKVTGAGELTYVAKFGAVIAKGQLPLELTQGQLQRHQQEK